MEEAQPERQDNCEIRENQEVRSTPDWSENALKSDHLWGQTNISGDFCYVGDSNCSKSGNRLKCSSCNVIVHENCLDVLVKKLRLACKFTFEKLPLNQLRKQITVEHHWVRRYTEKTKCVHCKKGFQSKTPITDKDTVPVSCSWCKIAYHQKGSCFDVESIGSNCNLGKHRNIIVPPNWIFKLPKDESNEKTDENEKLFLIRGIPTEDIKPLIVFINPKSGGNQGVRLLQKFQWLLNPRQIFDLTQGGPKMGLLLYKKIHNLRILACGGDGTVGWVLSVIDQIGITPPPAVGVLPLGTGNDLARALGWGGGYTDEPVTEILTNICKSQPILLDRWQVQVEKNNEAQADDDGKDNLPLNVVNNYFSIGVDAHIALEFHEAREAHPERFNSRIKNKMFYGQLGGKDLLIRKWKSLTDHITLECDGVDFTPKLKELKVHAIVFLNIASYGGGTRPWNRSSGTSKPSTEDGLIEVVGLTTYQLPLLQAGGHGSCITQCKEATIVTSKTIPMQVDGEACKVNPSILKLSILNQATMLARKKGRNQMTKGLINKIEMKVNYVNMSNYDKLRSNKNVLIKTSTNLEKFEIDWKDNLSTLRDIINSFLEETKDERLSNDWYFLDCFSGGKVYKIDRDDEKLHYITDVADDILYIMECSNETRPLTPKQENKFITTTTITTTTPKKREFKQKSKAPSPKIEKIPAPIQKKVISKNRKSVSKKLFTLHEDTYDRERNGPFYEKLKKAADKQDLKMVYELRRENRFLNTRNEEACNLLHYASRNNDLKIVNYLIKYVFTNYNSVEYLID